MTTCYEIPIEAVANLVQLKIENNEMQVFQVILWMIMVILIHSSLQTIQTLMAILNCFKKK